jgi:prepilin-type N-terminal cleavage/methylation domain-containing protein
MPALREESGFTLVELTVVITITLVVLGALTGLFTAGMRASTNSSATLASQANLIVAVNRLEFEARCTQSAALVSGGAGVTLTLPSYCPNATGTYTWCVSSGSLVRYAGSSCSGSGITYASNVSSATPFSCLDTGKYPRLQVALTSNSGSIAGTAASGTSIITLRNANSSGACA